MTGAATPGRPRPGRRRPSTIRSPIWSRSSTVSPRWPSATASAATWSWRRPPPPRADPGRPGVGATPALVAVVGRGHRPASGERSWRRPSGPSGLCAAWSVTGSGSACRPRPGPSGGREGHTLMPRSPACRGARLRPRRDTIPGDRGPRGKSSGYQRRAAAASSPPTLPARGAGEIADAGHGAHLTHPAQVAGLLEQVAARY